MARIYQEGFELDSSTSTEFNSTLPLLPIAQWVGSTATNVGVTAATPHANPNGDGGALSLYNSSVTLDRKHFFGPKLPYDLKYAWFGFAYKIPDTDDSQFGVSVINGGFSSTAKQVDVNVDFTGVMNVRVGGSSVASGTTVYSNGWHWFALEYFCHGTSGFMNLYVDDTSEITYNTADTQGSATFNFFNEVQISLGVNGQADDIVINVPTITYTGGLGGSGVPVIGNTVTGGTSGTTAVITNYVESSPGNGFLILEPNLGDITMPSGWVSGESLSDGSGWSSTSAQVAIDSNGYDKNSGKPLETFLLLLRPNSDTSIGLTGQDADQINNYLNINDNPFGDSTTYNQGTASTLTDVYGLENMPFSPNSIDAVEVVTYASRAGTIPGVELGVNPGLGTTFGAVNSVGSGGTFAKGNEIFDVNPDTNAAWTESDVNGTDVAVKLG